MKGLIVAILLFLMAIGVSELGCWFHKADSALYIGKISYRCKS